MTPKKNLEYVANKGFRILPGAPKCRNWLGHKFEPRFTAIESSAGEIGQAYVHDVCVRCGHVVAPSDAGAA